MELEQSVLRLANGESKKEQNQILMLHTIYKQEKKIYSGK